MTPTTRPALTEPATENGKKALADLTRWIDDLDWAQEPPDMDLAILAIEAEAVQRERERIGAGLCDDCYAWLTPSGLDA